MDLERVVVDVPLNRDLPRLPDDADELFLFQDHRADGAGIVGDLLAPDGPVHVVRPEVEGHGRHLFRQHDPVGLDVREVVQHETRHGDGLQVVDGRGEASAGLDAGLARLECEGDEREEPAGLVLGFPQPEHVHEALLEGLDMPVEHRAVRRDPHPVRGLVNVQPHLRSDLLVEESAADPLGEDLRAAARHGLQPGGLELPQDLLDRHPEFLVEEVDLDGRERLDVRFRQAVVDGLHDVEIPLPGPVRRHAAGDVDLPDLRREQRQDLLGGHLIAPGRALLRREVAELAGEDADVGVLDLLVEHEVDGVAAPFALRPRGPSCRER